MAVGGGGEAPASYDDHAHRVFEDGGQPETFLGTVRPRAEPELDAEAVEAKRVAEELDALEDKMQQAASVAAGLALGGPIDLDDSPQPQMSTGAGDDGMANASEDEGEDEDYVNEEIVSDEAYESDDEPDRMWKGAVFDWKCGLATFVDSLPA
eukprot:9421303-Pyramimonas_sp.AAC.1